MTEKEKQILAIQCESTRRALLRPEEDDFEWQRRKIPDTWLAVPDAQCWEERVGYRPLGYEEVKIENKIRYERGMHLAVMRNEPAPSSLNETKKETACEAFLRAMSRENLGKAFKNIMAMCGLTEKAK